MDLLADKTSDKIRGGVDVDELYMEQRVKRKVSLWIHMFKILLYAAAAVSCISVAFRTDMFWITFALAFLAYTVSMVFNIQYEYLHEKEFLRINKIDGWNKKRKAATVDLTHVELIAPLGNAQLAPYKDAQTFDFAANDRTEAPYVMVVTSKNGVKKLLLQLDEDMVESFKNRMPRKVISD